MLKSIFESHGRIIQLAYVITSFIFRVQVGAITRRHIAFGYRWAILIFSFMLSTALVLLSAMCYYSYSISGKCQFLLGYNFAQFIFVSPRGTYRFAVNPNDITINNFYSSMKEYVFTQTNN